MQCKHCGSIIRDNVKYCTQCGRSVLEIRNNIINNETTERMKEQVKNVSNKVTENIKNIDTDKMKEQFKNVSNNVVENVKNFDKEQAKQQTINFANNVKTDVKNFKTLSVKKKRTYIIALILVILLLFFVGKGFLSNNSSNIGSSSSSSSSSTSLDATLQNYAKKYENSAIKYTYYTTYKTRANGNTVYLLQFQVTGTGYWYVLAEVSQKSGKVLTSTDIFSSDVSTAIMYSSIWGS